MKKVLCVIAILSSMCACADPDGATRALQVNGYKNVQITGYDFFSCAKDDFYCTGFIATAPNGARVEGAVGSGLLFKGSTIRTK